MNRMSDIQRAINHIEAHLTEKIDYEELAKSIYCSYYHFQRVFSMLCGITLAEYVRRRRLSLAGLDIAAGKLTVTDAALKYGYDTPESFSRAFRRFHGILPSRIKDGKALKIFSEIKLCEVKKGGNDINYTIEEKPELTLVGFKRRFCGVPYGEERAKQEETFCTATRAKQWLLIGASCDYTTDYMIVTNVDDDGYDFYIAYELDEWTRSDLYNPDITGVDFIDKLGFETLVIPKRTYAVFKTAKSKRPISEYIDLRRKIVCDWLNMSPYVLVPAPEVVAMHWRPKGEWTKERFIEIRIPIEEKR